MAEFQEVVKQLFRRASEEDKTTFAMTMNILDAGARSSDSYEPENWRTYGGFRTAAEIEESVMKWAAEHPEKTMQDVFFEKFPNAPKMVNGCPRLCPGMVGFSSPKNCSLDHCTECWNRPAPAGMA